MKQTERRKSVSVYTRRIEAAEQSAYLEVPFDMPEGVEEIHVSYAVESHGEPRAVIDLGVRDGKRLRGWSGGARSEFRIGEEKATPGYLAGELAPGGWAVVHNAYKVPQEGCTVTVTVEFAYKTPRWLKGDLHTHTVNSDGSFTLEENAAIMEQLGCDFIAMTDHNTISQNYTYPRGTSVVMIPGMEFTTNFGHSNFLGVADPCDDFRVKDREDVNERIRVARERGAKIVLNHPHCDYCPWEWGFNVDHDWVEVWNGPFSERNQRTLDWWQDQLAAGRRLVAIGGSDTHRPDPYVKHAMPCTWVYADAKTADGILQGIGKGHVHISYGPEGPFAELTCGSYMTGDAVPSEASEGAELQAYIEQLIEGDEIRLISERGVEQEITARTGGSYAFSADTAGRTFYRVEIWRHFAEYGGQKLLAALTNPIYFAR
ncbi:CehA/McbA family metallohydrolase [Paenibacillus thalictri]|uniref:Phosphoesterase n=1 Tax=Paenibacillus thalictri TaxID=2527873 RepID=A0A4Q9DK19_9BACL|nr:CehA/McbA family metallohydrolase [Paenibacillus thalictri]TBL71438.1 phosphoesterase [Paenibacillus thalictri]